MAGDAGKLRVLHPEDDDIGCGPPHGKEDLRLVVHITDHPDVRLTGEDLPQDISHRRWQVCEQNKDRCHDTDLLLESYLTLRGNVDAVNRAMDTGFVGIDLYRRNAVRPSARQKARSGGQRKCRWDQYLARDPSFGY